MIDPLLPFHCLLQAYNSLGELKQCAGCEGGSDCCVYPHGAQDWDSIFTTAAPDLYVKKGGPPPQEWAADIAAGSVLYSYVNIWCLGSCACVRALLCVRVRACGYDNA
jgi:hypothetical protein